MIEWLNRWINPPVNVCEHRGVGYRKREENKCWCGAGLVRFYSKRYSQCVALESCGRKYATEDGVEIRHQR